MPGGPEDYSVVFATVGLAGLEESAIRLSRTLEADGAVAQASLVRQAFLRLLDELRQIARVTAQAGEKAIVEAEAQTRVRPDSGGVGGPRLEDWVGQSHPLPAVEGSVGLNYEPALYDNVPWWWTNEEGYSGHVGRTIFGVFTTPGSSRPDPAARREHAVFQPTNKGGRGTIQEPIPARRFVRLGAQSVEVDWHAAIRRSKARFVSSCEAAVAAAPPPQPRGARRARGRRRRP